ncbi:MAG: glycosyltransferase, partial [Candidatus Scalindua sp.]|nr:glycosyltransferase [Candidatus Scalindua sp.]
MKSEIKNPTISLCMIVKDEEENLDRCLTSARDIVDEIIIVDTGSTDRTVEIAKSYGAKVFNHPWEGSFSKARNYSLKYATCDWILYLDADEELNKEDAPRLKEIAKNSDVPIVSFIIKNKYKDSTQEGYARMVRFFKNFSGIYYKGVVHNTIQYSGKCLYSSITIIHHGYNLSEEKMEEKFLRTSALLKKQIEADPHNPVPYMYIGVSYMDRRLYEHAITNSIRAIYLAEENGFNKKDFLVSYYIVSAAYFEKKEFKDSEIYALKSVKLDTHFLDGYCLLAFAYYNLKEYDKFMKASESYLAMWSRTTNLHSAKSESPLHQSLESEDPVSELQTNIIYHTIGHKWKIHLLRGFCYLSNNQTESGNSEIDKAMNESTDLEDCLTLLCNFYLESNNIDEVENTCRRLLRINEKSVKTLFNLGHVRFQKGDMSETLSLWRKAVEIAPDSFDIRLLICKINIALENLEEVVTDCDQLLQALNMPRDVTIDSLIDLGNIFNSISQNLKERNEVQSAKTAYSLCEDLKREKTDKEKQLSDKNNPTISLCMIVKNEEFFLPKCLNSVKDFVDEIVIVDTGSTDETVKIAERYNAKIYHHPWENSFSKARNYSLKYATSDWIFILDADEELDAKDAYGLKTVIHECDADLLYLQVLDKTMDGEVVSVSNSERVFRNHLGIKYEGTVHNYLKYNGNTKVANIKLFHYGYNLDEEKMERKF